MVSLSKAEMERLVRERHAHWEAQFAKHFPSSDDLTLNVLKTHLLVEQHLNALLAHYCFQPRRMEGARLAFAQKLCLTQALLFVPLPHLFWHTLELLNTIRNNLAHNLESAKLQAHLADAKALAGKIRAWSLKANRPIIDRPTPQTDVDVVRFLGAWAIGYLTCLDDLVTLTEKERTGN
jgi:hypothetical protein